MSELQFSIDQKIVYPSQGVGRIIEVFEKQFNEKTTQYYKIYIDVSDMIVMVPVDNAAGLGIRSIVGEAEALAALELLGETIEPITSDWKLRYQQNLDLLKKGTIADIANIVRSLYHRSKVKELPILERKLYDNARKLLIDEIASATGKSEKEVESMIHAKLEPLGTINVKKAILDPNDEDDDDEFSDDFSSSRNDDDDDEDDDSDDDAMDDDDE
ncbi:MAG: CarD family transcriptional regulator [Treponemataceae bacterium]|nr:CarD family transcriptional regulator [Treponemataceae bacterium]